MAKLVISFDELGCDLNDHPDTILDALTMRISDEQFDNISFQAGSEEIDFVNGEVSLLLI